VGGPFEPLYARDERLALVRVAHAVDDGVNAVENEHCGTSMVGSTHSDARAAHLQSRWRARASRHSTVVGRARAAVAMVVTPMRELQRRGRRAEWRAWLRETCHNERGGQDTVTRKVRIVVFDLAPSGTATC
jgi:hypothetical protein